MQLPVTLTKPQADFLQSEATYPAFVGGFGSGKTQTLATCALMDASHSSSALVGIYAPTYDLLKLVNVGRMSVTLSEFGIRHKYHGHDKAIYTSHPGLGDFIFRSLDDPARIVGYETFRAHVDELDTLKTDHARDAWNQIIARNRQKIDHANQARAYTTPEGFKFTHERWVAKPAPGYVIYRAPTYSNPFLPADYVESLKASYPGPLIEAYIEGKFVNLTSGTIYTSFSRDKNRSDVEIQHGEPLYIGQDFNVGNMASIVLVKRKDGFHAVDEICDGLDTPWLVSTLKSRFEGHSVTIYPDASGKSRKTVDASKSDITLLHNARFKVVANLSNPSVRNRIVSVNNAFETRRLWVNDLKCPTLTRALEQQAYAPNGEPDKDGGFDHPNDALGYVTIKEMPVRRPVVTDKAQPEPERRSYFKEERGANWKTM